MSHAAATNITTGAAAQAAMMEAKKSVGGIVHLKPSEFQSLLDRTESPTVVYRHRPRGLILSASHQYLMGYAGLVFYTKSSSELQPPAGAEIIRAKKFEMVE